MAAMTVDLGSAEVIEEKDASLYYALRVSENGPAGSRCIGRTEPARADWGGVSSISTLNVVPACRQEAVYPTLAARAGWRAPHEGDIHHV